MRLRHADYAGPVTLASVFPLVTARALARPFTYSVPEGTEIGAVVGAHTGPGLIGLCALPAQLLT